MSRHGRRMPFGADLTAPDRARFRIWAPACEAVGLEVKGRPVEPMSPRPGGWFDLETAGAPGALYRFRIGEDQAVPDPASRRQEGDVHGWSVLIDPLAFQWRTEDWTGRPFEEVVLYELHVGLLGGFSGVAQALPALAELGVTAVELMPIGDFPGRRNWGYDGVLPFAPDEAYGSPDELKALVDRAHGLGLMVFLDVVYNHFGPDGNFLPLYAPAFFKSDAATAWGGAVDFSRPEVRDFFTQNALYWIEEYRFDGLRFDAVHAIKDPGWLDEMGRAVRAAAGPDRQVHLVVENDDNEAARMRGPFDAQWNDDFHHVLHVLLTGETGGYYGDYAGGPAALLARALTSGFVYQGAPSAHRGGVGRGEPSGDLPPSAFVNFLQNHDQIGNRALGERLIRLADPRALRAAVVLLLLSPQTPLLFMGEEIGSPSPFLYFTDHGADLAKAVREGRRNEFKSFPAFADPKARDAIPDPNDEATFERSRPAESPQSGDWRALYRRLLSIRREALTPRLKGARALGAEAIGSHAVLAAWRLGDGSRLSLAVNLAAEPVPLPAHAPSFGGAGSLYAEGLADGGLGPFAAAAMLDRAPGPADAAS